MRAILFLLSLAVGLPTVWAQGVVPVGLSGTEGNSSVNDFLNSSSFRMQMVFDASQFSIPAGASGRVDQIAFRADGGSTGPVQYLFSGGSVTLSTIPVGPDGLSTTFANNIGANAVTIYNGALNLGGGYVSGQSPQAFANQIPGITPFWYNPQQGNLLVDIVGGGGIPLFLGALDAHNVVGDGVSRVVAYHFLAESGTADSLGLVTRFNMTVVPEPSTTVLALLGLAATAFALRRRSR
jgi:hypothetical protein